MKIWRISASISVTGLTYIWTKFGTEHKRQTISMAEWPNSHNLKIQDGGCRHLGFRKNVNNSGLNIDICTKFYGKMHHGHAQMTTWSTNVTDGRTDRQTLRDSIDRACVASRGKNCGLDTNGEWSKTAKITKRWHYSTAHWHLGDVLVGDHLSKRLTLL